VVFIERGGRITEKIKRLLGKAGAKTYRKGGEKVLDLVRNKKKIALKDEEQTIVPMFRV